MSLSLEEIRCLALELEPKDRSALVDTLLESLDPDAEEGFASQWIETARRRLSELTSGEVTGILATDVFERLRQRERPA